MSEDYVFSSADFITTTGDNGNSPIAVCSKDEVVKELLNKILSRRRPNLFKKRLSRKGERKFIPKLHSIHENFPSYSFFPLLTEAFQRGRVSRRNALVYI